MTKIRGDGRAASIPAAIRANVRSARPLPTGEVKWSSQRAQLENSQSYIKCTACGANRPIAVNAIPASASRPDIQASAIMPVMMVADASTMPI